MVKFTWKWISRVLGLVGNVEVEPAISIKICPIRCLCRAKRQQSCLNRHVCESAVPIIAEQRIWVCTAGKPCASKDKYVAVAIIIVVRLHGVKTAHNASQIRFFGAFRKRPVSVIFEKPALVA